MSRGRGFDSHRLHHWFFIILKELNTLSEESCQTTIRLFVYGTLKCGFWNHARFCSSASSIHPAVVWGRLYHFHAGFPILEIPENQILAHGTASPAVDAITQHRFQSSSFIRPSGDWDLIHGEILTFNNPQRDLLPIDRLEGFRPGANSMYERVLLPALSGEQSVAVWLYWMPCPLHAERIVTGEWLGT